MDTRSIRPEHIQEHVNRLEDMSASIDRYIHLFEGDIDDTLRQAVGA